MILSNKRLFVSGSSLVIAISKQERTAIKAKYGTELEAGDMISLELKDIISMTSKKPKSKINEDKINFD